MTICYPKSLGSGYHYCCQLGALPWLASPLAVLVPKVDCTIKYLPLICVISCSRQSLQIHFHFVRDFQTHRFYLFQAVVIHSFWVFTLTTQFLDTLAFASVQVYTLQHTYFGVEYHCSEPVELLQL